jgi:hypothetical protein
MKKDAPPPANLGAEFSPPRHTPPPTGRAWCLSGAGGSATIAERARRGSDQEQPLVPPQLMHLRQVPLRTRVKEPHSLQASPS